MASSFKLPDLGEGLTEGEVARWLVTEGQEIAEDDPLVEIQTDKATVEIPSPYAGTVLKILVAEGDIAPVGTELVVIGAAGRGGARDRFDDRSRSLASRRCSGRGVRGACRRLRSSVGSRRSSVSTSPRSPAPGPGGRITEDDVTGVRGASAEGRREPLRGVRRVIAEHMTRAHREVPPVTWVEECDFEDVPLERLLPTVVKACADALVEFPELNARFDGDAILYLDRYDIGVAVQTDDGLVVPVVRGANEKSVDELGAEIAALAERARTGSLGADDLRGSTFTVSSAGKLAGLFQTPIVNHPEVAILSIGRVAPRAVVRDGEIVVRRTGTLAITFDHRVVDGARAAAFGLAVIARIESRLAAGLVVPRRTHDPGGGADAFTSLIWARISPPGLVAVGVRVSPARIAATSSHATAPGEMPGARHRTPGAGDLPAVERRLELTYKLIAANIENVVQAAHPRQSEHGVDRLRSRLACRSGRAARGPARECRAERSRGVVDREANDHRTRDLVGLLAGQTAALEVLRRRCRDCAATRTSNVPHEDGVAPARHCAQRDCPVRRWSAAIATGGRARAGAVGPLRPL